MALLHAHGEGGGTLMVLEEIFLHGFLDTLKLLPFLFLTYLLMEYIEHKAGERVERFMKGAGKYSPLVGGALGAVPQCGFGAAASSLYAGRVISLGTLLSVFLSTSDEMLPILISGRIPVGTVLLILLYKAAVGAGVGLLVDLIMRLCHKEHGEINIDEICDNDNCHCERGIFYSALHHTLTVSLFVLIVTLLINTLVFFVGEDTLGEFMSSIPVISHIVAAVFGLIPNCAASVVLATLATEGIISVGTMLSGLFSAAGVGLLVLFRVNRHIKENLLVVGILVLVGAVFGLLGDLFFPALI